MRLCHGSKLTMLSMRGGYLATESSRDTSCCVGSLNNSGITVKQCARRSGVSSGVTSQSANMSCGLESAVQACGRRLDQSEFCTMAEVSFPVLRQPSERKTKRDLC